MLENNNLDLLHCTGSIKRNDMETFCSYMADEHNC